MSLFTRAIGALGAVWSNFALRFALPPGPPVGGSDEADERLDAQERDVRILMSHWF